MAALNATNPTLADYLKSLDENGSVAATIEILNQTNEILDDLSFVEGNMTTGHRSTIRTGLPEPTVRKLYGKVFPTKSTREAVTDNAAMIEDYMEIDPALIEINGNAEAFKTDEGMAHIEGFGQKVSNMIFYANEATAPEEFTGLAPRFNSLTAENGQNIIDAGGTGSDNCSIWLVGWSPRTCTMFFPKGSQAGLQMTPKGVQTVNYENGSKAEMDITHMKWKLGLALRDWRYVGRICNIDKSLLTFDGSSGANLIQLMTRLIERVENTQNVRWSFYVPRIVREYLRTQITEKVKNATLTMEDVAGRRVVNFDSIPVRRCDALSGDEARVV